MIPHEVVLRPMVPGWLIGVGAVALLALVVIFLVRRPRERIAWTVRDLMVLALVGILVRPGYGEIPSQAKSTDIEILVVVDRTLSMAALDWQGDKQRLEGVRGDMKALTKEFPGARFSLITFGRHTRTDLPFSTDTGAFQSAIDTIHREDPYDGTGSLISAPVELMTEVLTEAQERHADSKRLVVFVSDGENTSDEQQESFAGVDKLVDGGLVLGYGTEEGGRMKAYEDSEIDSYVRDYSSDDFGEAVSKFDQDNLTKVASEMGVDFQHRTENTGFEKWADDIDKKLADEDDEISTKHEVYWIFALVIFGLALVELALAWRGFHSARRELKL